MIETKTTIYGCICGYNVDVTTFKNQAYFSKAFSYVPYGTCPSCRTEQLARVLDPARLSTHSTLEADDIDALTEIERDEQGNPTMVDSGKTKQELSIVDGKPAVIEVPVMTEKTRELTKKEKAEKFEAALKAIDRLDTPEKRPPV